MKNFKTFGDVERERNNLKAIFTTTALNKNNGITLIALIITIVVMLILVGVVVSTTINSNLIGKAKEAGDRHEAKQGEESNISGVTVGEAQYDSMQDYVDGRPSGSVLVKVEEGAEVALTKENFGDFLGRIVTNYKGGNSIKIDGTEYTVSPDYRLYYIDFDNKYGDGAGTIYLKAECTSQGYKLPTTDTTSADAKNIKIKNLNPALYGITPLTPTGSSDVISPSASNENMKAVTWLTNTSNWTGLADTTHAEISGKINYIVGSPSLEMMMDSYNAHYKLTGDTPYTDPITTGDRKKLFYKYDSGTTGYKVGPFSNGNGYGNYTSDNSVHTDDIDSMYYPASGKYCWLASPSAEESYDMMVVSYDCGGQVTRSKASYYSHTFCPVVSLKPSTQLELADLVVEQES